MNSTTTSIALPWVVLLSIMSSCSLVGNIVVVIVIIRDRLLKGRNYTLALVCNMAISDALYVGLAIPLILVSAFTKENWILGNIGCKLMMFLPNFCIASSIYSMVVIAFDRRVTILTNQPRVYRDGSMYLALLLVWLFSAAVSAPAFYEYSVYQRSSSFLKVASHCPEVDTGCPHEHGIVKFVRRWPRTWVNSLSTAGANTMPTEGYAMSPEPYTKATRRCISE